MPENDACLFLAGCAYCSANTAFVQLWNSGWFFNHKSLFSISSTICIAVFEYA
jgi:hypothetical protein